MVEQCNREIRTISHLLHPPLLDELGLRRALQDYVEGFAGRSAIVTTLAVAEDLDRLPAEIETALFRWCKKASATSIGIPAAPPLQSESVSTRELSGSR